MEIAALIIVLLLVIFLVRCICIVPQANAWIVEFLGRYHATWEAGLHLKIPILYRVVKKVSLKEQVADFEPQPVITKDNVTMMVDSVVFFEVFEPKMFSYGVERPIAAIENLSATTLRNIIGSMTLDETLTSRDSINGQITNILDEATDKWGIKVNRVEVKNIQPPRSIQDAMEKQMRAERDRRAAILMAEGDKQSKILEAEGFRASEVNKAQGKKDAAVLMAEGEAEAKIKRAEAEAESIRIVTEAFGNAEDARNYLVAMKYIDTLGSMVTGQDNKVVYMPYEATGVLSSLGTMKELFQKTNG